MSELFRELSYNASISRVRSVQFGLLSPEEIERRSVAEIFKTDTFHGRDPVQNGLYDLRCGPSDNSRNCATCQQNYSLCPGHAGHLRLAVPVFYPHMFSKVVQVVKCVCWRCSRLLMEPEHPDMAARARLSRQRRWEEVYSLINRTTIKHCGQYNSRGCGAAQPSRIVTPKPMEKFKMDLELVWPEAAAGEGAGRPAAAAVAGGAASPGPGGGGSLTLGAAEVRRLLERVSDDDAVAMGFSPKFGRPEWMICTVLSVPPPCVRPRAENPMGQRAEDDITAALISIIKFNNIVKKHIEEAGAADPASMGVKLLQVSVGSLINNQAPDVARALQRTGRNIVSLSERLKGKEGRVRGNLLGKRVDYSARTVITPDPWIGVDELGVPKKIATVITFPETVSPKNLERLRTLVRAGPRVYPGARFVRSGDRTQILRADDPEARERKAADLVPGDVVHRHLLNGDYVLFNRQPSLHKMSMMAHRVRVMPFDTFRLNACVTPSFNADFDGDEMNMHACITPFSMAEIACLAAVPTQVVSPKNGKPIVSIVQDVALGVYELTLPDVSMSTRLAHCLAASLPSLDSRRLGPLLGGGAVRAAEVLSLAIPATVNLVTKGAHEAPVRIHRGRVTEGILNKNAFQARSIGIAHSVHADVGPRAAADLFDSVQRLVCGYFSRRAFSVGLADVALSAELLARVAAATGECAAAGRAISDRLHRAGGGGGAAKDVAASASARFEEEIQGELSKAIKQVGEIIRGAVSPANNRIMHLIDVGSGSKGAVDPNFVQMTACLGQQVVEGGRLRDGFEGRTLPHYLKYEDGAESRGFVASSFSSGLTPCEFVFHAMAGRIGLTDTAVRTSESGYISRKLIKAMEDFRVHHDMTVRNAVGQILQIQYGEDSIEASCVESHPVIYAGWTPERMAEEYLLAPGDGVESRDWDAHHRLAARVSADREMLAAHAERNRNEVEYAVGIARIVLGEMTEQRRALPRGTPSDLDPDEALAVLDALLADLVPARGAPQSPVFSALLRMHLAPRRLLREGMSRRTLARVDAAVRRRFWDSLVPPGEMVGIVAAQSLSEPTTQLTLNTFHQAGVQNTLGGLPRLKELFHISKHPKLVLTRVYPVGAAATDRRRAARLRNELRTTTLKDVVQRTWVYYDPGDLDTGLPEDRELLAAYRSLAGGRPPPSNPWLLRMRLDRAKVLENGITMLDVADALERHYTGALSIMHSDDNDGGRNLVFRLRILDHVAPAADMLSHVKALELGMMDSVVLKGGLQITTARLSDGRKPGDTTSPESWVIDTDGLDLRSVLAHPLVDAVRTRTNFIVQTYEVLGIEAARSSIIEEIGQVMKDAGASLNPRHIMMLVDTMTHRGRLQSADRHGFNRTDAGPIARCCFEETSEMLRDAAVFSELDRMTGTSACIMLGQVPPGGTGSTTLVLDVRAAEAMLPAVEPRHGPAAIAASAAAPRTAAAGGAGGPGGGAEVADAVLRFLFSAAGLVGLGREAAAARPPHWAPAVRVLAA